MNLNMIRTKKGTEDSILSITKNCETLIKQTHTKPQETLEIKKIKPRETFHFITPISIEGDWMMGIICSEVFNSIFNITEENNNFKVYKFLDEKSGGVSYEKVRDEIEIDLEFPYIRATDLQNDILGPNIIGEYREQVSKRKKNDEYMRILAVYNNSVFRDSKLFSEQRLIWLKMILDWF